MKYLFLLTLMASIRNFSSGKIISKDSSPGNSDSDRLKITMLSITCFNNLLISYLANCPEGYFKTKSDGGVHGGIKEKCACFKDDTFIHNNSTVQGRA